MHFKIGGQMDFPNQNKYIAFFTLNLTATKVLTDIFVHKTESYVAYINFSTFVLEGLFHIKKKKNYCFPTSGLTF